MPIKKKDVAEAAPVRNRKAAEPMKATDKSAGKSASPAKLAAVAKSASSSSASLDRPVKPVSTRKSETVAAKDSKARTTGEKVKSAAAKLAGAAASVAKTAAKTVIAASAAAKKGTSSNKKAADTSRPSTAKALDKGKEKIELKEKSSASKTSVSRKKTGLDKTDSSLTQTSIRPEEEIRAPRPTDVKEHFFHEHRPQYFPPSQRDLPQEYGDTRLVLMARDPQWIYAYWEVSDATREEFGIPRSGHNKHMVLRMYDCTGRDWPQEAARYFFDAEVSPFANNWYLRVPESGKTWCAELGMFDESRNYLVITRSNLIITPRDFISQETDSDWMTVEETFRKLYELSGAFTLQEMRGSETLMRSIQKQILPSLSGSGEDYSSGGLVSSSMARPVREQVKDFWLQVHTELILYGATEPDAKVTVQGRSVRLNPDGTFSMRFALPDGEQVLDVRAQNRDGDLERSIVPVVKKHTREK